MRHGTYTAYSRRKCRCGDCREGQRVRNQRWKDANPEKHKVMRIKAQRKYRLANNDKVRAHAAVHRAVVRGDLIRATACECCGSEGFCEASHDDYEKQLEVEWLCSACHGVKDRRL